MKTAITELKGFPFHQRIIDWRKKRHEDQLVRLDRNEARFIRILQDRYGYTKEQATTELRNHYSKAWLG